MNRNLCQVFLKYHSLSMLHQYVRTLRCRSLTLFILEFLEKIWTVLEGGNVIPDKKDILFENAGGTSLKAPKLPEFYIRDYSQMDMAGKHTGSGFSLHLEAFFNGNAALLDGSDMQGRGLKLEAFPDGSLLMEMGDSWSTSSICSEPCLVKEEKNLITIIVDGGPGIISFVVNGKFLDGAEFRQFGWQRFSPILRHVNWSPDWKLSSEVAKIEIFSRALMTVEAICLQSNLKS